MRYNFINLYQMSLQIQKVDLFKDISLPTGISKENVINSILLECDELMPITTDPILFKAKIDSWFTLRKSAFEHIYNVLIEDYNPIHNYDRHEVREETRDNARNNDYLEENKTTNKVSAFNSDTMRNSDTTDDSIESIRKETEKEKNNSINHLYGNIGVTTTQQMIESELTLRMKYDIYKIIANEFRKEFMLNCM